MKLIYKGKTKDVFELPDGNIMLKFKDDACGENGVFDPGANQIGLSIEGKGKAGLKITDFFFQKINKAGFNTHFVSCDVDKAEMIVRPATVFGCPDGSMGGIEVICRYKAYGSFIRRYGQYISEGAPLDSLVEVTLKNDERGDPLATMDTLEALGILDCEEYGTLISLTKKICGVIRDELSQKGLELIDIKLEFGKDTDGEIMLIDEVSGDIMRVFENGKSVSPLQLTEILTNN